MVKRYKIFGLLWSLAFLTTDVNAQNYVFEEGMIGQIKPEGWLRENLNRQATGLTGHAEALSYPYNTCLWAGYIPRIVQQFDSEWWRYEQTAYYTDGLLRLGYLIDNKELIAKGEEGVAYTMEHVQNNGRLGDYRLESLWPMAVFFRTMKAEYEYTGNKDIVKALEKNYLSLSLDDLVKGHRHILNIEGMLWTYGITHNTQLLKMAEEAFRKGGFPLDTKQIDEEEYIHMHGVTYSEQLKLPMMLYAYTGNKEYLRLAVKAERQLERNHILPDGLPTSAEYTLGNDIDIAHETCNITDYTWTLGYFLQATGECEWADRIERVIFNAGMGSVTKDFRSLQYFSSVNQIIVTGQSDNNEFKRGSTWMAYRPTHETECCAGNVSRFMPNFTSRLWMRQGHGTEDEGIVATMYAPSTVNFNVGNAHVRIAEETFYPFDGEITFRITTDQPVKMPFTFRIPGWCAEYKVTLNGKTAQAKGLASGAYATIDQTFHNGDVIQVKLTMTPRIVQAKEEQGLYVECGPLLFAYAIPEHWVEDTEVHLNLNGKAPQNAEFKCWNITPTGPWNYALSSTNTKLRLKQNRAKLKKGLYPFDPQHTPLSIQIPVKEIEWELLEGSRNPDTPKGDEVRPTGLKQNIKLVPYGATQLRLTVFPKVVE